MEYQDFLIKKEHSIIKKGFKPLLLPEKMFDFQKYVTENLCLRGRGAGFMDTGTGKTIIELALSVNHIHHTNKPVLIITPLAVAFQFLTEAEKFEIDDISYSRDGTYKTKIVICNYERLDKFNPYDFDCVILDESSILKNDEGVIRNKINNFLRKVKYRYLFTATPSPNDFIELGTSSEALGYMGYTDMLTKFFKNNEDTIKPQNIGTKWILKGHAIEDFFRWVSSWSISMRKPSDLGFSDEGYILPELKLNDVYVKNKNQWVENGQILMFGKIAKTRQEISKEVRMTLEERCHKAVELANIHESTVYWCNLNDEGDLINKLDKDSVQLKGQMKLEEKEEILLAFSKNQIKKLITKPKITAFGLNWQHCNHTTYFPTFSHEQWYQALRRFWRFGQKREVYADRILSEGQVRIIESLKAKEKKSNELYNMLNKMINSKYESKINGFDKNVKLPKFL
jgi:ERCC4-related helicase